MGKANKIRGTNGSDILGPRATSDFYDGKGGNDIITGGGGNDTIKGGKGFDEARFTGPVSEYTFTPGKKGLIVSHNGGNGADGTDLVLKDVEHLRFADGTVIDPNAPNNNPHAAADSGSTSEDSVFHGASVLANDFDFDIATGRGQTLSVTVVNGGAVGSPVALASGAHVTMNADGTYTYDPAGSTLQSLNAGQTGTDSFTYTVSDGVGGTDTGTVTITVNGTNDAPKFTDSDHAYQFNVTENVAAGTFVGAVAALDVDSNSAVSYAITGGNTNNAFTINSQTGVITTAGPIDFETLASYNLTVTASDGVGGTDSASVAIGVNNVDESGGGGGGGGGTPPTAGLSGKTLLVQFDSATSHVSQQITVGAGVEFTQNFGLGLLDSFSLDFDNTGFKIVFDPLLDALGTSIGGKLTISDVNDTVTDMSIAAVNENLLVLQPSDVTATANQVSIDFGLAQVVFGDSPLTHASTIDVDLNFA